MKPTLIFTDYIEEHDEFIVTLDIVAKMNDQQFVYVSPQISQLKATDDVLNHYFRLGLNDIFSQAMEVLVRNGDIKINVSGMVLLDKMSFFDIKQTVPFNNSLHENCRETNILFAGL